MPRAIRLKEFPKSTEIVNTPPDWYVAARDSSLLQQPYKINTDENGFILPDPRSRPNCPSVIFIGDSVLEGMFSLPEDRICSRLQQILSKEENIDVAILNGGYSGATILHSFNTFLNKIIPLRPTAVVLMTGMVDYDVSLFKASFWSKDCWIEPIIEIGKDNTWRDPDKTSEPSFENQSRVMAMFSAASRIFEVPVWYATLPHRQVFSGEYVNKAFKDRGEFDRLMRLHRGVNEVTRRAAFRDMVPLFDLEMDLADRTDIFYDIFHLNPAGGEAAARSLIKCGIVEGLQAIITKAAPSIVAGAV
jgi:hypothetical protein